jgi:hypothetical protein
VFAQAVTVGIVAIRRHLPTCTTIGMFSPAGTPVRPTHPAAASTDASPLPPMNVPDEEPLSFLLPLASRFGAPDDG